LLLLLLMRRPRLAGARPEAREVVAE
jgi:hypothetical protein